MNKKLIKKECQIHIRVNDVEKQKMFEKASVLGFKQLSEYLRFVGINAITIVSIEK